ncbi:hypothetical protein [Streptomyces griseoaurantiacus]|jgi:hypothetical protein|uniref:Uncharacterized protein n=1 Tax=Streptomyces griseoaurantiacus TaxID=68213 RepID=A0A1G7QLG6_9ACTN|nr:hypothetical protein [Streptomyces jietaisiensis]SDF98470.1 hypothetical protein SAMN05216260_1138 [Streptomyces jietaisiensis]
MLNDELLALASAAGTAVATAAGTDTWEGVRARIGGWLSRGDARREEGVLAELDSGAAELLGSGGPTDAEVERYRAAWRDRVVAVLSMLDEPDRENAARDLRQLIAQEVAAPRLDGGSVHAQRDVQIRAEHGSLASGVINGDVNFSPPPPPVRPQG